MMMNLFRLECRRAFWNPRWGLVALAGLASFAAGTLQTPLPPAASYGALDLWMLIMNQGMYPYAAALMAALPYADSLLTDRRRGVLRANCLRAPYRISLGAKVLANACAGALAAGLPALILALVLLLTVPPQSVGNLMNAFQPGYPLDPFNFLFQRPYLYLAALLLLTAAFGALYASLGMALSTWIDNPAWVLAAPFLVFSLARYLIERARNLAWAGDPWAMMLPYTRPQAGALQVLAQYAAVLLFCLACYTVLGGKERMLSETDAGGVE